MNFFGQIKQVLSGHSSEPATDSKRAIFVASLREPHRVEQPHVFGLHLGPKRCDSGLCDDRVIVCALPARYRDLVSFTHLLWRPRERVGLIVPFRDGVHIVDRFVSAGQTLP